MKAQAPRLVRAASLTNFAEVARQAGLDPNRLLSEFELPARCLREPELRVPMSAIRRLLEAAAERSGVEAFGLLMAETRRLSHLGPVGLLMREQPTLRLALKAATRYGNSLNAALFLSVEEIGKVVVVREELIVGESGPVRQTTELAIGVAFRMMKAVLGPEWNPKRVCFAHDAPADRSVHLRVFGRIVEFGHDFNGIVCSSTDLDRPNPNADPEVARYALDLVDSSLGANPSDVKAQVHQSVVNLLGSGRCTIEVVGQTLGIPRRTIHRRLAAEGQTFSEIIDEVRRELASRYVADRQRSLSEVSALLGFSAPASFSRWYRRQFGDTPSSQHTPRTPRVK